MTFCQVIFAKVFETTTKIKIMNSVLVFAFVAFVAFCGGLSTPACVCDRRECEIVNEVDCPGLGVVVWDPCK